MSAEVFVDHLSYSLGEIDLDVEATVNAGNARTAAAAFQDAGFERHRMCAETTGAYDLAKRAVQPIRDRLGDVGAIIYATCIPSNGNAGSDEMFRKTQDVKHLMAFPASLLQADFGLHRASVIGLNQQACTSMLGSLRLARALLHTEPDVGRVLCVSADRFPPGSVYEQAYNLISDGAAACVVSAQPAGYRLLASHAVTNGGLARASDDETVGSFFTYACRVVRETLRQARLSASEIDWVVPQNTNLRAWQILGRALGIDACRVFCESMREVGHVISADNIVNLKLLDQRGGVASGMRVLLFMAGFGVNWQAVILEKV